MTCTPPPGSCSRERAQRRSARCCKQAVLHFTLRTAISRPCAPLDLPALGSQAATSAGMAAGADGALYVVDTNNDSLYRLAGDPLTVQATAQLPYRPYMPAVSPRTGNGWW